MYIPPGFKHQYGIPLIMEVGSLNTKIGFAGMDRPNAIIPSFISVDSNPTTGVSKHGMEFGAQWARPGDQLQPVLQNGVVEDWEALQTHVDYALEKKLLVTPSENPLFYIDPPLSTKEHRQKLIEFFFQSYGFNGLFLHKAPVLSTYLLALQSSLVVDIGAQFTHVVPVLEGFINTKAVIRAPIGGETITREIYRVAKANNSLRSYFTNESNLTQSMRDWGNMEIIREVKHLHAQLVTGSAEEISFNENTDKTAYELPDKNKAVFGKELYMAPQVYFGERSSDNFKGIHHMIGQALEKCEPEQRKDLLPNIQLIGGGSSFITALDRMQNQLVRADFNGLGSKMKVFTTNQKSERAISSWLGASIMASMRIFDRWIVSKKEYEEHGFIQVEKRL